jgi:hypothetical protein
MRKVVLNEDDEKLNLKWKDLKRECDLGHDKRELMTSISDKKTFYCIAQDKNVQVAIYLR